MYKLSEKMPPDGIVVNIFGDDCMGPWSATARWVKYKGISGLSSAQIKRGGRWLTNDGSVYAHQHRISGWSHV